MQWMLSNVAIVCFDPLVWFKVALQTVPKNADVRPLLTFVQAIDPNNITSEDAKTNFIAQTIPFLELVT